MFLYLDCLLCDRARVQDGRTRKLRGRSINWPRGRWYGKHKKNVSSTETHCRTVCSYSETRSTPFFWPYTEVQNRCLRCTEAFSTVKTFGLYLAPAEEQDKYMLDVRQDRKDDSRELLSFSELSSLVSYFSALSVLTCRMDISHMKSCQVAMLKDRNPLPLLPR